MSSPALNPLVGKIRASYPGVYDDMDDASLTKAVLKKYPQYEDLAAPSPSDTPGLGKVPTPKMETSTAGRMWGGPTGTGPDSNLPSPKGQMAQQTEPDWRVGATAVGGAALTGAAAAAEPILPTVTSIAARHPLLTTMAIGEARHLPYVGRFIPPGAELLPFLRGRSAAEEPAELPEPAPQPRLAERVSSSYPPQAPTVFQESQPSRFQQLREEEALKEQIRNQAEAEDRTRMSQERREWFRRNDPSTPKSTLLQKMQNSMSGQEEDLTPQLEESLRLVQKMKQNQ